jgi:cytochrome c5
MIDIQQHMNKLSLSVISMSVLLALSACSSDDDTDTVVESPVAVNESTETTVVMEEAPAIDSAGEPESIDKTTVTEEAAVDVAAEPETLAADAGAKLYESNCQVCHSAGLLNAPKYGDTAAWAARLGKGKETLYMHSAKGFNKMPAQAVDGVTEAQVKAAVDYMLASVS